MNNNNERLEYLRSQINAERISTAELIELQGMADQIDPGDVQLLEWAGVPEFPKEPEDTIYWDVYVPDEELIFGGETVRIIDEDEGGVIAYTHREHAERIVNALREAAK